MKFSKTEDQWKEFLESFNVELADFSSAKERHKSYLSINCRNCGTQERVRAENLIRRRNHPCLSCANRAPYDTDRIKTLIAENGGIYLSGTVRGKESIVSYICCCGNQVEKTAHDVTRRPKTCRHCRAQGISKTQLEKSNNLEVAKTLAKARGGKCLETGEPFPTTQPILWECSRGHSWRATLTSVKSLGTWCPECSVSIAENSIRAIFEGVFSRPFPAARPEFLRDVGLSVDGYNEELSLAFEHQGIQHYQYAPMFHKGNADLYKQMERDALKSLRCQASNVKLVTIPYSVSQSGIDSMREFLSRLFRECNIAVPIDPMIAQIYTQDIYDWEKDPAYLEFRRIVEGKGGSFAPSDYQGATKPLKITCGCGHTWLTTPLLVRKGNWCPVDAGVKKYNIEEIREKMITQGWKLDEEGYANAHKKMSMRCPQGHKITRTWNAWQKQQQKAGQIPCYRCRVESFGREFLEKMLLRGFEMDIAVNDYRGQEQKVNGLCIRCGVKTSLSVTSWKDRSVSPCCGNQLPPYHRSQAKSANGQD